ncbi:gliding motility-associated C-terminal domain-containing protein [Parvicella tangerina]|uniref:Gliding motility-associated C-terminal domain-containing protein n=1 Tax=Parvicella tangerina TaxID=2829795 RepID=A0A916JM38_9FLAO|nr:gliding motility-associated C-terminal domain-containing protein [Parvicella tangerina]CAG5080231.1 hypothetical protein CRYO30217_01227 [Parvicella tangerina]
MKKLLILLVLIWSAYTSFATHVIGGNIDVCQTGPNTFSVTMRVYRDCNPGNSSLSAPSGVEIRDNVTNSIVQTISMSGYQVGTETVITLGDSCYTPTGICVEEYIFTRSVTLPDNPNGYYIAWDICCRNGLISNADVGSSFNPTEGSVFYVQIPDPALAGGNCSPSFGGYPTDGYFCLSNGINDPFIIDPQVTDADGDSLVYSLINPYNDGTTQKPFNLLGWQAGHSAVNLLGNTTLPNMVIDSETGLITCYPENIGVYVFAIMVKEYRNGVQIGETVRDVQYSSLNCTVDAPPTINMQDTVAVYAGDSVCVDVTVTDADGTDTLYVIPSSNDFDLMTTFVYPDQIGGGDWQYDNFNNTGSPAVMEHFDWVNLQEYEGVGEIYLRYCWQPNCESIDETYAINLLAYSYGCSGSDTSERVVYFDVQYEPADVTLNIPDSISVTYDEEICFEVLTVDETHSDDPLGLTPVGGGFDYLENYVAPAQNSQGYYYTDFWGQDTVYIPDYSYNNGEVLGKDTVAIRYCWTPGCGDVYLKNYELNYEAALYTECFTLTENKVMQVNVEPPSSELQRVPNVFTPNKDGDNDYFKLGGTPDPCYDSLTVTIYNRWGKKVYESEDPYFEWDGTIKGKGNADCAEGTYFVIIQGSYGSTYDLTTGEAIPTAIEEKYTIQLLR